MRISDWLIAATISLVVGVLASVALVFWGAI
jgi:hypothetical protein